MVEDELVLLNTCVVDSVVSEVSIHACMYTCFYSCVIVYHQNVQVSCFDRCSMLYLNCILCCIVLNLFILLWHGDVAFAHVPRQFNWHLQVWVALRHRSKRGLWWSRGGSEGSVVSSSDQAYV